MYRISIRLFCWMGDKQIGGPASQLDGNNVPTEILLKIISLNGDQSKTFRWAAIKKKRSVGKQFNNRTCQPRSVGENILISAQP